MTAKFSVVIPLYNKESEISRCLRSVLAQTTKSIEVIVVNDGSTDGGARIVEDFCGQDARVHLHYQSNQGLAGARNQGVLLARSLWVAFIDADDEWMPDHLEKVSQVIEENANAGCVFTAFWVDRGDGWRRPVRVPKRMLDSSSDIIKNYYALPDGRVLPSATAIRKDVFELAGKYHKMFGEDIDLNIRVAAYTSIAYVNSPTAIWHVGASNRMCVQQKQERVPYTPGSLCLSLDMIVNNADITSEKKSRAQRYVQRREQKAIVETCLLGDKVQAVRLYDWWKDRFGESSVLLELLILSPQFIVMAIGWLRAKIRRSLSILNYVLAIPESKVAFERSRDQKYLQSLHKSEKAEHKVFNLRQK